MGFSLYTQDEYCTFSEFSTFVSHIRRYIEINACVWNSAQQSVLLQFFTQFINRLENTTPVDPNIPWGSPGAAWPASNAVQEFFVRARDAVPKAHFFKATFPYTVNPFNSATPLPAFPTSAAIADFFLVISFFWGCYKSKDNAQEFLDECDYPTYAFADAAGNVDFGAVNAFISGMSRIHFCGKEVTLAPNRMVILQDPALLLTGRLVKFPSDRAEKCCQIIAKDCMKRVNCGIYTTKLVNDIVCDVSCGVDPCKQCNVGGCRGGCIGEGGPRVTRFESEFASEGRDSTIAGDEGPGRQYSEVFITIRPFINSDLLIPEVYNRMGKFGEFPWDLGLPDEFLTNREINERRVLDRENPLFDEEIEPGNRGRELTGFLVSVEMDLLLMVLGVVEAEEVVDLVTEVDLGVMVEV